MELRYSRPYYGAVVLAGLIDAALTIGIFVLSFSIIPESILTKIWATLSPDLSILLGFVLYRLLTILKSDSTIGMKVFGLVFLNSDEGGLGLREKILASVFILFRGVDYYKKH